MALAVRTASIHEALYQLEHKRIRVLPKAQGQACPVCQTHMYGDSDTEIRRKLANHMVYAHRFA